MEQKAVIRDEPAIQNLLQRLPNHIVKSFSDEQLIHLHTAICSRSWGHHSVDIRGVFTLPFYAKHFYYVVLVGKNYRKLSRYENALSSLITAFAATLLLVVSILLILLVLYLIKSALGIDLFPNFSFGIWSWFKSLIL